MPKTKPRIDKKSAITFKLVHRSQHDPLIADETAPQHVLKEIVSGSKDKLDKREEQINYGIYFDDDYDYLKHLKSREEFERGWEMIEERRKVNKTKLELPSSVFPSIIKEEEGMLNKAAPVTGPRLDLDPDIVQAMEDDFDLGDPSNQLDDDYLAEILEGGLAESGEYEDEDEDEDDFDENVGCKPGYSMARFEKERFVCDDQQKESDRNSRNSDQTKYTSNYDDDDDNDDDDDDDDDNDESGEDFDEEDCRDLSLDKRERNRFHREETKSVFTDYSLTSSVLPRNAGLSLIDEKFEVMFEREYGNDMDMGALDLDDIEGSINPNNSQALKKLIQEEEDLKRTGKLTNNDKIKTLLLDGKDEEDDSDVEKDLVQLEVELDAGKHRERLYDCESILSTYSTLYNHPKMIRTETKSSKKLAIDPATGIVLPQNTGLTKKNLRELDASNRGTEGKDDCRSNYSRISRISQLSERDPNETTEERKTRKAAFRELKKERRLEKKANRTAFKLESDNQKREMINLKNNMTAMKLV